jgi:polyisoprenoid-binding protein YceI
MDRRAGPRRAPAQRDFFDVEAHPKIAFSGRFTERVGELDFKAPAGVGIRGIAREVVLDAAYLGQWETPFWVGDENRGTMRRIGFEGRTAVDRHEFGVSWQDQLSAGGRLVSDHVDVILDVEAIHEGDLEKTGAIEHYRG